MKALLVSPPMPLSLWSLPQTLWAQGCKATNPPLGLITVAALLPREWELRLADLNTRDMTEEDWNWADLVMLSGMIVQKEGMLELIRESKQRGKTVVAGGPYPTSLTEEALDAGCDFVVQGEAENTIDSLLSALDKGHTHGVFSAAERPDVTSSPIPRYDLLRVEDYLSLGVQTSRGCPFDCEFCDIVNLYGRKVRYKTPDQVVEELETLYRLGWRSDVVISDDNFIGSRTHATAILRELIAWNQSRGEPFNYWCQASVNLGQDLEMIDLMTEANFSDVFIGVESPDKEVLESTGKYQNIRNPLLESLANINKNGLGITASFIIGFDGEKKGMGDRICAFVEQSGMSMVMVGTLGALPNTRLWDRLKEEGRLLEDVGARGVGEGRLNFIPSRPNAEILEEFTGIWEYLFEPSRFLARAYRYHLAMRPTRRAMALEKGLPPPPDVSRKRIPLRRSIGQLLGLFYLVWWLGMVYPCRVQFWRQLIEMRKKNPSRFVKYVNSVFMGLILRRFSRKMLRGLSRSLDTSESVSQTEGIPHQASSSKGA